VSSGVFTADKVEGIGHKGLGNTTMVDVQTLLKALLTMTLRSACFIDEASFW
jgi:hypothetical protein